MSTANKAEEDLAVAEEASPISSRPPATLSSRWPRQETVALLHIRSQMDSAFRDTTVVKAPLWEIVSRKLEEMGYNRSAKKCKEKFENVQKYYKRTRERQDHGHQDNKSYKFFTQLDAIHQNTNSTANTITPTTTNVSLQPQMTSEFPLPPEHRVSPDEPARVTAHAAEFPLPHEPSSSEEERDNEIEYAQDLKTKRKRSDLLADDSDERMMAFFEGLMKQVMQKQEIMQQRFLEAIEKREQERMTREEAWKRQDMARLVREQQLMSQERTTSASRDAAIIAFLQRVTGQTIHLPSTAVRIDPAPLVPVAQLSTPFPPLERHSLPHKTFDTQQQSQHQGCQPPPNPQESSSSQNIKSTFHDSAIVEATPNKLQNPLPEGSSSRWPKEEVLALIQLRSDLESRYQETVPKGPLWEDISSGMKRLGYNRNAKRCKEKWENINKYFKKVKESSKKRPEDAKTCPYFHELDVLYSKRQLPNTGSSDIGDSSTDIFSKYPEQQQSFLMKNLLHKDEGNNKQPVTSIMDFASSLFDEHCNDQDTTVGEKQQQPVDIILKQDQPKHENLMDYNFCDGSSSDDDIEDEYGGDDETEAGMKLTFDTQYKSPQNIGSDNLNIYHTIIQ